MSESLAAKRNRIEATVAAAMKTGKASETDIRRVIYALDIAGYDVVEVTQ